jgi:hypothetical protein
MPAQSELPRLLQSPAHAAQDDRLAIAIDDLVTFASQDCFAAGHIDGMM